MPWLATGGEKEEWDSTWTWLKGVTRDQFIIVLIKRQCSQDRAVSYEPAVTLFVSRESFVSYTAVHTQHAPSLSPKGITVHLNIIITKPPYVMLEHALATRSILWSCTNFPQGLLYSSSKSSYLINSLQRTVWPWFLLLWFSGIFEKRWKHLSVFVWHKQSNNGFVYVIRAEQTEQKQSKSINTFVHI